MLFKLVKTNRKFSTLFQFDQKIIIFKNFDFYEYSETALNGTRVKIATFQVTPLLLQTLFCKYTNWTTRGIGLHHYFFRK